MQSPRWEKQLVSRCKLFKQQTMIKPAGGHCSAVDVSTVTVNLLEIAPHREEVERWQIGGSRVREVAQ